MFHVLKGLIGAVAAAVLTTWAAVAFWLLMGMPDIAWAPVGGIYVFTCGVGFLAGVPVSVFDR